MSQADETACPDKGQVTIEALIDDLELRLSLLRRMIRESLQDRQPTSSRGENRELKKALLETIRVLEETKRSFKSKQLGQLREHLLRVLAENGDRNG